MKNSLVNTNGKNTMTKRRRNPNSIFNFNSLDKMMDDIFSSNMYTTVERETSYDSVNKFMETENGIKYTLPVPGCSKEDVSVEMEGNVVTVEASYESDAFTKAYHDEFVINLETYNIETAEATVENGILTVTFSKNSNEEPDKIRKTIL